MQDHFCRDLFLRTADLQVDANMLERRSPYQISQEDYENLEEYIAELHATFSVDVYSRIELLRQTIEERQGVSPNMLIGSGREPVNVTLNCPPLGIDRNVSILPPAVCDLAEVLSGARNGFCP